jgi:hypothetical protein
VNKKVLALFLVLIICAFGVHAYLNKRIDSPDTNLSQVIRDISRYEINVIFNPEERILSAHQKITIKNCWEKELDEIFFHIYPNAYETKESAPFPKSEIEVAYPNGLSSGKIDIKKVFSQDTEIQHEIDGTILKARLSEPLMPGQQINIEIQFDDIIPNCLGRYGYGETTFNLANWYPILCVYDENGWNTDPYYAVGDPFYSDVAQYEVSISTPAEYIIAASGSLTDKVENEGRVLWKFKAEPVRDFAWVASEQFDMAQEIVGKTRITSFFHKRDEKSGKQALNYASKAIGFFNDYFGEYPYGDFAVASCDFFIGGMEYPNLVMIGRQFYNQGQLLEYIVVHETAHQWWYGIIGNNQIKEAWLDEALTEYSTVLYYENVYGKKTGERVYNDFILNPYQFYEISNTPGPILRPLSQFTSWGEYDAIVYSRGAIMLKDLEYRMGKVKLREALRFYFKDNLYKNAATKDFIKAVNKVTGTDWSEIIYDWLKGSENIHKAA